MSQTFTGNSASILAGLKIVRGLLDGGHFTKEPASSKTMQLHDLFVGGIKAIEAKYPGSLQGPYGLGGMVGFTPFDGSAASAKELTMKLYEAGLMGFIAGDAPSRVRFLMPLLVTQPHHIHEACRLLEQVVAQMVASRQG